MTITPVEVDGWFGFGEFKNSCTENYDFVAGVIEAQRIFIGPWENRSQFILDKILPEVTSGTQSNVISAPNEYPDIPGAVAHKVAVKGFGETGQDTVTKQLTHEFAELTVSYKTFSSQFGGGGTIPGLELKLLEESVEATCELVNIPYTIEVPDGLQSPSYKMYGHKGKTKKKDGELNKVIPTLHYKLRVPIILDPEFDVWHDLLGKTNSSGMYLPSHKYIRAAEFRYDGYSALTKREFSSNQLAWEVTQNFAFRATSVGTWDKLPAINETGALVYMPITPHLYESGDLNKILWGSQYDPEAIQNAIDEILNP
jgi:hypothetical protein